MSTEATEALQRLKEGNARFVNDRVEGGLYDSAHRKALASGQEPYAILLSCSDSRVAPEIAFDTGLGELFVVRVAGNVANRSSIASIEYAVAQLGTKLIVVMAHESCGAVAAAMEGGDASKHLSYLLEHIQPAVSMERSDLMAVAHRNARLQAERLIGESEIIRSAVESDGVRIVSALYHFHTGAVDFDE